VSRLGDASAVQILDDPGIPEIPANRNTDQTCHYENFEAILIFVRLSRVERLLRRHQFRRHQRAGRGNQRRFLCARRAARQRGLAQHPFLYTGEWDHRKTNQTIFVVRDGKVAWTYSIPINDADGTLQELGDATMLSNGNIVFCRKVGASEVTPDKKIIWNMDAPKGTEIHSIQPIGLDHVLVTKTAIRRS
jgi:hypothetical protein